jgi:Thioesterase-like superfamily
MARTSAGAEAPALFLPDGERFIPTVLTQGPWRHDLQFGGAAAALLTSVVERVPSLVPMQVARLTVDLVRPVPIAPLTTSRRIVREGKRIQVVEAALLHGEVEVARAVALRLRLGDLRRVGDGDLPAGCPAPLPPATAAEPGRHVYRDRSVPGIGRAVEFRLPSDAPRAFDRPTWVRLLVPVIAGEPGPAASGIARLALAADFASGFGHPVADIPLTGINADISLHVVRPPRDEWLCLAGTGWTSRAGIGHAQATLSDRAGVAATATLSRLVDVADG